MVRSQEASPIPRPPKSMTALRRSLRVSRLPVWKSPWNQRGGRFQAGASSAASHRSVIAAALNMVATCVMAVRVAWSRADSGWAVRSVRLRSICSLSGVNC